MRLPEIRYPIFWMVGVGLLAAVTPIAWPLTQTWREAIQMRWTRVVEGPGLPNSPEPRKVAGMIVCRGLLLRDGVVADDRPDGRPLETIGRRMFVDIYDIWPLEGRTTHFRVGNRHPFGWIAAVDLLPFWNSRLVLNAADSGPPLPVVNWDSSRLHVVVWEESAPWERISRDESIAFPNVRQLGVFVSRPELLSLLRRLLGDEPATELRLRALTGRLADPAPITPADIRSAREYFPARVFESAAGRSEVISRLSRLNEQWKPEATWSGLEFSSLPLTDLP